MHTTGGVMDLPLGMRFSLTDEEVISYYLTIKVNGYPLPDGMDHVIPSVHFYDLNPEELIAMPEIEESQEYYFFTEMEGSGKRCSRKAKGGFWKATAKDKPVYDHAGSLIGYKRSLDFCDENKKRTKFKMHEYTTANVKITSNKTKYWVVNKIYRNNQTVGMKRINDADEFYCESPSFSSSKRAKKDGDDEVINHMAELINIEDITYDQIFEDDRVNHSDGQSLFNGMDDITNMFDEGYMPSNVFAIPPDQVPQDDPFDVTQFILSESGDPDSILADPKASQCPKQ